MAYHSIGDIQHEVYVDTAKQYLDYLLVVDALPRVAIEAKAIDVGFSDAHGAQVVQYCSVLGIEWAVVTNGREWRLYHGFEKGPLAEKLISAVDLVGWNTDGEYDAVFEQLWLVSKDAFQGSGGPGAWLMAKQLDRVLRKSLADPSSPEIKYIRRRLADEAIMATADQLATWFKRHLDAVGPLTGSSAQVPATSGTGAKVAGPPALPGTATTPPGVRYYRVMLGPGSVHAEESRAGGFIGTEFGIDEDLVNALPEDWRAFNKRFVPVYLASHPDKKPVAAGLACGALWTVSKGLHTGDVVLSPNGKGQYLVGRVTGGYQYVPGGVLPHRRPVTWLSSLIERAAMSKALRNSTGSIGTVCNVSGYREEIESLLAGKV